MTGKQIQTQVAGAAASASAIQLGELREGAAAAEQTDRTSVLWARIEEQARHCADGARCGAAHSYFPSSTGKGAPERVITELQRGGD